LTLRIRLITQYFKDAHEGGGFPNIRWLYGTLAWPTHLSYKLLAVVG